MQDFIIDRLLFEPDVLQAFEVATMLSQERFGLTTLHTLRINCFSILTEANPKRDGGSLLHVAAINGNLKMLDVAIELIKQLDDDFTKWLHGAAARDNGTLKATPLIAAADAGQVAAAPGQGRAWPQTPSLSRRWDRHQDSYDLFAYNP